MGQKIKKLAVVLRGHKRTWNFTKKHTFDFFDSISDHVDYYLAIWKTSGVSEDAFRQDFHGKNLKKILILEKDTEFYTPWLGPAYLSNKISKFIFEEECYSKQNYDMVFDTRPDVAFLPKGDHITVAPNTVYCDKVEPEPIENGNGLYWQGLADQCFVMDTKTHTIWNQRLRLDHVFQPTLNLICGNHSMLWAYSQVYKIESEVFPWLTTELVRPNIKNYASNNLLEFHSNANLSRCEWNQFSLEEKIRVTEDADIDLEDYVEAFGVYHRDRLKNMS